MTRAIEEAKASLRAEHLDFEVAQRSIKEIAPKFATSYFGVQELIDRVVDVEPNFRNKQNVVCDAAHQLAETENFDDSSLW